LAGAVGPAWSKHNPNQLSPEMVVVAELCAVWWLVSSGDKAHTFWKQRRRISTNDSGWF